MQSSPTASTSERTYQPKRGVIVLVDTETQQQAAYDRLRKLGFTRLRVVTA